MGYIQPSDLLGATTQYVSALGTQGVDFSQYSTPQLQSLINRVSAQIDGYCRQTHQLTNHQERHMGRGTNVLFLRRYPLAQIEDSVFSGGSGNVSQSLAADTTITGSVAQGATSAIVADVTALVVGQYLQFVDSNPEAVEIATVGTPATNQTSATVTFTTATPTLYAHSARCRVIVNTVDFCNIVLPGSAVYAIPTGQLIVDADKGELLNYTPLMFQNLGYATIFPRELPILVRYTHGYAVGSVPAPLVEVAIEQCRRWALQSGNLAVGGVTQWKLDDQSVSYAWTPAIIETDLADLLGPWRRDRGIH